MKVEADINAINIITASVLEQAAIPEIMDVKTFKTDVLVFIGNTISLESHQTKIFSIRVSLLILRISLREIKEKMCKSTIIHFTFISKLS